VDLAFHSARAISALVAAAGYLWVSILWGWGEAWLVVAMSVVVAAQSLVRRSHRQQGVALALGVDIVWVAVTFLVVHPPALVVVPGLTYLVVAPVLAMDGWRAAGMVIAAKVGVAAALAITLGLDRSSIAGGRVVVLAGLAVLTHLPTMTWLLRTATRTLRSREDLVRTLAVQEARLRMVTDSATDAIVAIDAAGKVRFANRALETMLGWSPAETLDRPVAQLIPAFGDTRAQPIGNQGFVRMAAVARHRRGKEVPIELTMSRSEEGGRPVYVCVLRDESIRRAAERRIEYQASLLDQVRLAVVGAGPDGHLAYANATAVATFGLRPESIPTLSMKDLLLQPDQAKGLVGDLNLRGTLTGEMELRAANGECFPALVTVTKLHGRDGEVMGFAGIAVDITARKQTEERLATLLSSKDEFVTSVSHELRTPLTVILGLAEELRRDLDHFRPDDVRDLIDLIADQSRDLANIVQDLLVIGRADAGGSIVINAGEVDVSAELATALELYVPAERACSLEGGEGLTAWVDPGRFRQVIRNLVTNAVRYGGPEIKASVGKDRAFTYVTLSDNGPGVPAEDAARIFEPYVRSGPAHPGSMGLGLAVARKLSLLMRGDLSYQRHEGWSTFELRLPASDQSDRGSPADPVASASTRSES
jgi:PAS domain S-box-containing protein